MAVGDGFLPEQCFEVSSREHARGSREQTAACEVLVRRCVPLVRACVRPYRASLESAEDLMQVGYLGLMTAIHN